MALRTRKVYDYRGYRVYLRHLSGNLFEYVIPVGKDLFEHSFLVKYGKGKKNFTKEGFDSIDEMMRDVANNFLDTLIYQRSFRGKINKLIFNAYKWRQGGTSSRVSEVPGTDAG